MERLRAALNGPVWSEFWTALAIPLLSFEDVGLAGTTPDDDIWRLCQQSGWVLLTGNRNREGPRSLEETIRREGTPESLPVMTVASPDDVMTSSEYVDRVVEKILDYLFQIDNVMGTGRLFVP
jgi:hypothetical protein